MVKKSEVSAVMRSLAKKRWRKVSKQERSKIGRKTVQARWAKQQAQNEVKPMNLNAHLITRLHEIQNAPIDKTYVSGFPPVEVKFQPGAILGLAEGDSILTPQGLAEWLQIPVSTVRELTRKRAQKRDRHPLPFFHIGKRVRFNKSEVLTWLTKLEQARKN